MAWKVDFLRQMEGTSDMTLNAFYKLYKRDIAKKARHHPVRQTAAHRSQNPPLPGREEVHRHHAVGHTRLADAIQPETTSNGLAYKESYLRTIDNQLSAMLNHVVRYYNLPSYPMSKVDRMGSKKTDEMRLWAKDEYKRFFRAIINKDQAHGLRGAVLAGRARLRGSCAHTGGLRPQVRQGEHHQDLPPHRQRGRADSAEDPQVQRLLRLRHPVRGDGLRGVHGRAGGPPGLAAALNGGRGGTGLTEPGGGGQVPPPRTLSTKIM